MNRRADEIGENMLVHLSPQWAPGKFKKVVRVERPYLAGVQGVTLRFRDGSSASMGTRAPVQVDPASIPGSIMRVSPVQ